ncbi:conjugal transfer protein TraH [Altericroceibacterium spongiae]|nr:conjugal transfer protein TraH [Altericroceibacterium spongiae]
MACLPAQANVGGELNEFFDDLGGAANASGPSAYKGQSAGYYTGGNVWTRFPQKTVNPVNLQLPSATAGCGGIDLFGGSFSFINSDEMVAMLKSVANNALGFAFQLAIKSISPMISSTIEDFAQKAQQMNQFNMNSCELAQGLVGGLWGKSDSRNSEVCKAIANSQGWATDWAKSRQNCNAGGERSDILASNTDDSIPSDSYNYTWYMLNKSYPGFDRQFKEYLMTLVGTVIYTKPVDGSGKPSYDYIGSGDRAAMTALLDGSSDTEILRCDSTAQCLNPTYANLTISENQALKPRVRKMITSMMTKAHTDEALSADEVALLGATSIPLYKIITVNAAAQYGGLSDGQIDELAEIVGIDLLQTVLREFTSYVLRGKASFHNADDETLGQWREQLTRADEVMRDYGKTLNDRLTHTMAIVDRTVFLERTLRNSVSPQMSAALGFRSGMVSQGLN